MLHVEISPAWTIIASISALASTLVAIIYTTATYKLLRRTTSGYNQATHVSEYQIYRELSSKMENPKVRQIFKVCDDPAFEIDLTNKSNDSNEKINRSTLQHSLLNVFEDLNFYRIRGLVTIDLICMGFANNVLKSGSNEKIAGHVAYCRTEFPTAYEGFEQLYNEIYANSTPDERRGFKEKFILPKIT